MMHKNTPYRKSTSSLLSVIVLAGLGIAGALSFGIDQVKAAPQYPAQVIDLTNWKQTLPVGSSNKPTEIKADKLNTYSNAPFFQVASSGEAIQFRAPVNGVTTSGSGYPRSELREMSNGGKELASWSTTNGAHVMYIEQAITAVPEKKKHVVAGQIHDSEDDVIVIRLEYPKLFIDVNGAEGPTLDANYKLGKKFKIKFVAEGGKIKIFYNENATPAHTISKNGSGYYFKAGAYAQSNCSKESECSGGNYGEVMIYDLWTKHAQSSAEISAPIAEVASEKNKTSSEAVTVVEALAAPQTTEIAISGENVNAGDAGDKGVISEKGNMASRIFQAITNPFRRVVAMLRNVA